MATQVHFTGKSGSHVMNLVAADTRVSGAFPNSEFYGIIGSCWQETQEFQRQKLVEAAEVLLAEVRRQWEVLPYHYSFECKVGGREDSRSSGSGGASGFHIEGREYSIWGGPARCYLQEMKRDANGMGTVVDTIDVRGRKKIDTDDWGPIKLSRRKIKLTLPEQLASLLSFLQQSPDTHLNVLRSDGEMSVMELVKQADDGNEGAEEMLSEMGGPARRELIEKLSDPKTRKYHHQIAWLLLTVLPSPEARVAVEQRMEREKDAVRKKDLLVLLAATPSV